MFDAWGIQKIFPTTSGGREWSINMTDPTSDTLLEARNATLSSRADGSWYCEGAGASKQTRIYVKSPTGQTFWKNVEITGYFKVESATISGATAYQHIQQFARGGYHSDAQWTKSDNVTQLWGNPMGSGYKSRLGTDAHVAKEVGHSVYSSEKRHQHNGTSGSSTGTNVLANMRTSPRWVGFKTIIYSFMDGATEKTRIRSYMDNNAEDGSGNLVINNNWTLVCDVIDGGGWSCESNDPTNDGVVDTMDELIAKCPGGVPPNSMTRQQYAEMIINWSGFPDFVNDSTLRGNGNVAALRWDGIGVKFKYFSVREIEPST